MATNGIAHLHPRPKYYFTRPDGTCTALVAVDELPMTVRLVDVPVSLPRSQLQDMITLGEEPRSEQRYNVMFPALKTPDGVSPSTSFEDVTAGPDDMVLDPFVRGNDYLIAPSGATKKRVESWVNRMEDQTVSKYGEAPIAPEYKPPITPTLELTTPNGAPPIYGKKVYCTHWLRHGECDFIQQGCLYKHEMPDELTLKSIGIRPYPRWYMDAHPEKFADPDGSSRYGWGPTTTPQAPSSSSSLPEVHVQDGVGPQYPFGMDKTKVATSMAAGRYSSNPPSYQPPIPWSAYNAAQQAPPPSTSNGNNGYPCQPGPFPPSRTAYVHQVASARGIPPPSPSIIGGSAECERRIATVNIPKLPSSAFNSDRRRKDTLPPPTPSPLSSSDHRNGLTLTLAPTNTAPLRNRSIFSTGSVTSTFNRHHTPLTPQPAIGTAATPKANGWTFQKGQSQGKIGKGKSSPPAPERVKHKRFFIPPGEATFVENVDGGDWGRKPQSKNGGSDAQEEGEIMDEN